MLIRRITHVLIMLLGCGLLYYYFPSVHLVWKEGIPTIDWTDIKTNTNKTGVHDAAVRTVLLKRPADTKINDPFPESPLDNWKPPELPEHLQNADQGDLDLIAEIRNSWILSPDDKSLNITNPENTYFAQVGQDMLLDDYFRHKTGGFYVECGAFDGEIISNTLFFEREKNWEGLLIEANPTNFKSLLSKHRNAYLLNACLSPTTKATTLNFKVIHSHPYLSRLETEFKVYEKVIRGKTGEIVTDSVATQCFPLYSILEALDGRHIDFFVLDIEGTEKQVLQTVPFDKIDVDLFLIETGDGEYRDRKIAQYATLMGPYGYKAVDFASDKFDIGMVKM